MSRNNIKTRRIILELLHNPDGSLTKYRIAKETKTNISWVIHFLKRLEQKKLVRKTKVLNFDKLIDYYLTLDSRKKFFEFYIPQLLEYLKKAKRDYALTTYSAENLISHHLFPSRTDVYVREENIEAWKKELFKKGLTGKGNLRLIVAHDNYLFKFVQKINNLKVVTIPLLMIDLKREGGVCMQAYEYLVKKYVRG
jgi:DNA-binding MarR family transcriptional regulator